MIALKSRYVVKLRWNYFVAVNIDITVQIVEFESQNIVRCRSKALPFEIGELRTI